MKIIKKILKYIIIAINIILYILSSLILSKKYFILFTIILISLFSWNIYKKIKKFRGLKNNNELDTYPNTFNKKAKILGCISIVFNLTSIVIIGLFSYYIITYEGDITTDFLETGVLVELGKDDYYDKMSEKRYENMRIIYNKDIEATLPLIESYIEEINTKNNKILGVNSSDKLTIQIDYDEEVFLMRSMLFTGLNNDKIGGYYNKKGNTIYLYTKNPIRDILMNLPQVNIMGDGFSVGDSGFRENLFHEYTHYAMDLFMEENHIDNSLVPVWFEEGMADYSMGNDLFFDTPLEYISLKKLKNSEEWYEALDSNKYDIYQQSRVAVSQIVAKKGENALKDILLSSKDKEFETLVEENMNCSFENFENSLKKDIKEGNITSTSVNNTVNNYSDTKIKCLEDYIKYDENSIEAYELLGTLYEGEENNKQIDLFKYAVEKNPKEFILWHRLGLAYESIGKNSLAEECFYKANLLKE